MHLVYFDRYMNEYHIIIVKNHYEFSNRFTETVCNLGLVDNVNQMSNLTDV